MGAGAHKTSCSFHCRKMVVRKSGRKWSVFTARVRMPQQQCRETWRKEKGAVQRGNQWLMYSSGETKQHEREYHQHPPCYRVYVAGEESGNLNLWSTSVLVFPLAICQSSYPIQWHGRVAGTVICRFAFIPSWPLANPSCYSLGGDRGRRQQWAGLVKPALHEEFLWSEEDDFCWPLVSWSWSLVLTWCWWRPQSLKVLTRVVLASSRTKAQIDCRLWWTCSPLPR